MTGHHQDEKSPRVGQVGRGRATGPAYWLLRLWAEYQVASSVLRATAQGENEVTLGPDKCNRPAWRLGNGANTCNPEEGNKH